MTDYLDLAEIVLRILEKSLAKPKARRSFSKSTKAKVLKMQNNLCKACGKKLDDRDFDHIDRDSSNNSLENCQALCLDCHRKKNSKHQRKKVQTVSSFEISEEKAGMK